MPTSVRTENSEISAPAAVMPNSVPSPSITTTAHPEGRFFSHPEDFPLEVRTLTPWPHWPGAESIPPPGGLRFFSGTRLRLNASIRLTIPIRHRAHEFQARVSEVRQLRVGYEVTAVLSNTLDVDRLAAVEQVCAKECTLLAPVLMRAS